MTSRSACRRFWTILDQQHHVFADIKQLELRLARLPLTIARNRGYELVGSEKYRRLLLANILGIEINEYHFFHFSELEDESFFMQFVNQEQLLLLKN
ncbi:MAG: hypothetical protein IPF67_17585 [Saprospiraceae bacterium]|nr:hypothetical protein [Candidatus Brachybacter algidus]